MISCLRASPNLSSSDAEITSIDPLHQVLKDLTTFDDQVEMFIRIQQSAAVQRHNRHE